MIYQIEKWLVIILVSLSYNIKLKAQTLLKEDTFNQYWNQGSAEISSYALEQARYGELHEGHAVLIYVTEPFSKQQMVKSDYPNSENIAVLKLNATKKFTTGIYPYSMMTSSFFPLGEKASNAIKMSTSVQDWCGQSFMELERRKELNLNIHSYFQGESVENAKYPLVALEDDIWSIIRIKPADLPVGEFSMVPGFFYLNLKHQNFEDILCSATITTHGEYSEYTIKYPSIARTLSIQFESKFPYRIMSWEEQYYDGYGVEKQLLKTKATKIKTLQIDYWNKNKVADRALRKTLGL